MPLLKCGFSQRDITPAVPGSVYIDGYGFRLLPAEGVRDRIFVKVCAIECGDKRFTLFSFDLCGMSPEVYDYVAGHIENMTGMRRDNFALTCTHTHSAPACGLLEGLPINWDWFASVAEAAADAAEEAFKTAAAGRFEFSVCGELVHSYNRRGREPIDRRVRTAVFAGEDGEVRGILATAACHPVINTSMNISADYPSVFTREAAKRYPGVPAIFICGRGADIDPYNPERLDSEQLLETLGREFSDCVLDFADTVRGREGNAAETRLACGYRLANIPMKPYADADYYTQQVQNLTSAYRKEKDRMNKHFILRELDWHRAVLKEKLSGGSPDLLVPLQALLLESVAAFAMLPFEVLTLTGNKVERMLCELGYPPEAVFVCGCTNSVNGYLSPEEELEFGGYEFTSAAHWYGIAESGEKSEAAVLKGIESMVAGLVVGKS